MNTAKEDKKTNTQKAFCPWCGLAIQIDSICHKCHKEEKPKIIKKGLR